MNYSYDLPDELQNKIISTCLNCELHEYFLKRTSFLLYCDEIHDYVCEILIYELGLLSPMSQPTREEINCRLLREWNSESDETRDEWKLVGEYAVKFLTVTMGQRIA